MTVPFKPREEEEATGWFINEHNRGTKKQQTGIRRGSSLPIGATRPINTPPERELHARRRVGFLEGNLGGGGLAPENLNLNDCHDRFN